MPVKGLGLELALAALLAAPALAQPVGTAFTYQGRLSDGGSPASGTYDFRFLLYDAMVGGVPVGPVVTSDDAPVSGGLFTVSLDFGGVFTGAKRFLEIGVRPGASGGAYTTVGSRQELTPSPHAMFSSGAPWAGLLGVPAGFADGIDNDSGGDVTGVSAGTGLTGGGASGAVTLAVDFAGGGAAATASRSDHIHFGQTWGPASAAAGLQVENSSATGRGLHGHATAATGSSYGVYGETESNAGIGVGGFATGSTTGANFGVYGVSSSSGGRGVFGVATAGSGATRGVQGYSYSPDGSGVYGLGATTSGANYGVYGQSNSGEGVGVYGFVPASASGASSNAVYAQSDAPLGTALTAIQTSTSGGNVGLYAGTNSPTGYAIIAVTPAGSTRYAGQFTGNVQVTGTLSKGGGSFKIDHPLDPANKYLYHSFVESPDMKNVYDGVVTTGAGGEATVELPEWFEALNGDFRYQLTVIDAGEGFAQAKVSREIEGNRFTLRTSRPGVKVSWQVTGIRRDAFAEQHRIRVEEDKPEGERGKYLHPLEHGQPAESAVDYQLRQRLSRRDEPR